MPPSNDTNVIVSAHASPAVASTSLRLRAIDEQPLVCISRPCSAPPWILRQSVGITKVDDWQAYDYGIPKQEANQATNKSVLHNTQLRTSSCSVVWILKILICHSTFGSASIHLHQDRSSVRPRDVELKRSATPTLPQIHRHYDLLVKPIQNRRSARASTVLKSSPSDPEKLREMQLTRTSTS